MAKDAQFDSDINVHTSLPPFVPGEVRGTIHVRFPVMKWDCATPPPAPRLNVHLKWWGEKTEGCVFRVPIEYQDKLHPSIKPSSACYNIQSNWKKFKNYLQDIGHLSLVIGLGRTSEDMLIMGECAVPNMAAITPGQIEKRSCAVVTSDGSVHLGRLVIELVVKMDSSAKSRRSVKRRPASIMASPLKGVDQFNEDTPINVVTVPAQNKEWKPVKQVKLRPSLKPKESCCLNNIGKELLNTLIEQTKTLHGRVIAATDSGRGHYHHDNQDQGGINEGTNAKRENENHMDLSIELTPPTSPSDSMMELATALACVSKDIDQPILDPAVPVTCHQSPNNPRPPPPPQINIQLPPPANYPPGPQKSLNIPRPPVTLVNCSTKEPELFHLLLEVHEGSGLMKSSDPTALPSTYIQCRLFCLETPVHTKTFHETNSPKINLKQIFPVYMAWNELLERLQRGCAVVEVWDSATPTPMDDTANDAIKDELIGLVKISLYPLYAAVVCSLQTPSHKESLFPVVAVDGCCPVRDPLSGDTRGYLNMKLILGLPTSIPARSTVAIPCQVPSDNEPQDTTTEVLSVITESTEEGDQSDHLIHENDVTDETDNECGRVSQEMIPRDNVSNSKPNTTVSVASGGEMVQIDLLISQALHLPLLATPLGDKTGVPPCTYVSCHPHPSVTKISTSVCENTTCPFWDYHCTTDIPKSFVEASFSELEFQIWSLPPPGKYCANTERQVDSLSHIFLGRAFVDLIPLQCGLRTIAGWYNITDLAGEIRGQVKIAVTPRDTCMLLAKKERCFSGSRSLLPVEFELCSQSFAPLTTISFAPPTSMGVVSSQGITTSEEYRHSNEEQSLSILRRQLQAHIGDLEVIQDTLEAKLKDDSITSMKPHPLIITSELTPPLLLSSTNSVISSLNSSIASDDKGQSLPCSPFIPTSSAPPPLIITTPTSNHMSPVLSLPMITTPTEHHMTLTPPLLITTPTAIMSSIVTSSCDCVVMATSTSEDTPITQESTPLLNLCTTPTIQTTPTSNDTPLCTSVASVPLTINDIPSFNATPTSDKDGTIDIDNESPITVNKPRPQLMRFDNSFVVNKEIMNHVDQETVTSLNDVGDSQLTNHISPFINPLATLKVDDHGDYRSDVSSSSESNINDDLKDKVITMATVEDGRSSANTTTEDTTIIVDTTPTKDHAHKPSDDSLIEEEEEVKKLFDQLLKEDHHYEKASSIMDTNDRSTCSSTSSIDDENAELILSDDNDPSMVNHNSQVIDSRQQMRSYSMADCRLPNATLADKLLNLRRSVLSRRPPRPLPPPSHLPPLPRRNKHSFDHK